MRQQTLSELFVFPTVPQRMFNRCYTTRIGSTNEGLAMEQISSLLCNPTMLAFH